VFAVTCSESGSISNRIGGKFESISSSFGYPRLLSASGGPSPAAGR
jgi:hypothetical protein